MLLSSLSLLISIINCKKCIELTRVDGTKTSIDAEVGACFELRGSTINKADVASGFRLQFFSEENCNGSTLGFGVKNIFQVFDNAKDIKSVRVLNEFGTTPNKQQYYFSPYYSALSEPSISYYNFRRSDNNEFELIPPPIRLIE